VSQFLATYSKSNSGLFLEQALKQESSLYPAPVLTKSPQTTQKGQPNQPS